MRPLRRLWPALEALPGLAAVTEEWKDRFGEDFDAGRDLLRLTNRRAEAYPCPSPGGVGCPRRVVDHGDGRIVAVCGDGPKRCDRLVLTKRDIVIHELDARKLCVATAVAFGVDPAFDEITGLRRTYRVGDYHPEAGKRFPIFLTIPMDHALLRDVAARLCAATDSAFILLVPTLQFVDVAMMDLLGRRQARFVALADIFGKTDSGKLAETKAARALLAEFSDTVMPGRKAAPVRFMTPPGSRWEDIVMEYRAEEVINIRCKGITRRVEPEHLGMKSQKNGKPTNQWVLLQSFARRGGLITWSDPEANDRIKQQKRQLSRKLRVFFGIEDDPIVWDQEEQGYRTRFIVR
jgi:hypothetical protein